MAGVFGRGRPLTIEDSFHRQERRWSRNNNKGSSSRSRKLTRSDSISSRNFTCVEETPPPSDLPSSSSSSSNRKQLLRSMVGFLSRTRSGKDNKPGSFTMTEPASPASASSLSRSNSESSAQEGSQEDDSSSRGARGRRVGSRPRVSFDEAHVTTVFIEQMKEDEVRNTFYCRSEYAAFKEAYRMHRDTSTGWCRGNDVLPCNCTACRDDLVEGGQPVYSAASVSPHDNGIYDSALGESPPAPPSPYGRAHIQTDMDEEEAGDRTDGDNGPPSPVGAVFHEKQHNSRIIHSGGLDYPTERRPSRGQGRRTTHTHMRSQTWGVGSIPLAAAPATRSHNRGGSLDDWGVNASVREAVKCHGEAYAYKTLRLQGFSDLYIRSHFLSEG